MKVWVVREPGVAGEEHDYELFDGRGAAPQLIAGFWDGDDFLAFACSKEFHRASEIRLRSGQGPVFAELTIKAVKTRKASKSPGKALS